MAATISDNTKGNPYHDEEGKFTEKDNQGTKVSETPVLKNEIPEIPVSKFKLNPNINLANIKNRIDELKQIATIPFLKSAQDIINHFDKFFVERLVKDLDNNYGKHNRTSRPYDFSPFKFRDGRSGLEINMFTYLLAQHRYKSRGAQAISREEYDGLKKIINTQGSGKFNSCYDNFHGYQTNGTNTKILAGNPNIGCGMVLGYRGIPVRGNDAYDIGENYVGKGNVPATYGEQGCYGTVHYVAMSNQYANSYSGSYGHIYKHIIDVASSKIAYDFELRDIQNDLRNHSSDLLNIAEKHFSKFVSPDRAKELATGFVGSINDLGFVGVMSGADLLVAGMGNGNQIDILNFGKAKILKDW